jgi:hypothetical protein
MYKSYFKNSNKYLNINNQNIDNSECFGVKCVKIYPEMTSQYFFEKIVLVDYIGIFFLQGRKVFVISIADV